MDRKARVWPAAWPLPFGWLLLAILGLGALYVSKSVLIPVLLALIFAYAFDPVVDGLEKRNCPRFVSIWLIFSLLLITFILVLIFGIPMLQDQSIRAFQKFPAYLEQLQRDVLPALDNEFGIRLPKTIDETFDTVLPQLKKEAPLIFKPVTSFVLSFFTNTVGMLAAVANLMIVPIIFYYLLRDFDVMKTQISAYVPFRHRTRFHQIVKEIDRMLSGFLRGQLWIILLLGIVYGLGLSLIGVDFSVLLGMVAAIGEIVPYIGFSVGLLLSLSIAALQFQDFIHPLFVLLLFGGVQAIQGIVIAPWVMGKQVGLHPLAIILAVYIGGDLFGFIGVLLAVPGAAIVIVLFKALAASYRNSLLYRGPRE